MLIIKEAIALTHLHTIPRVSFSHCKIRNRRTSRCTTVSYRQQQKHIACICYRPVQYRTYSAKIPCVSAATSRFIARQAC